MGAVFQATDRRHDRLVAIKAFDAAEAPTDARARFLREVRVTAGLMHPALMPVFDSGEDEGLLYYVMPLVRGETLRDRMRRGIDVPAGAHLLADVAEGLAVAHRSGIVHRDVKPENILVVEDRAILTDFGVAFVTVNTLGDLRTETGLVVGTPVYMSPEQLVSGRAIDGRSDVYALGCVLHEIALGHPPHASGASLPQLIARRATQPLELPATIPAYAPLRSVLERALAVDPSQRFGSAGELAGALRGLTRDAPMPANPRRTTAVLAVALALIGVAAWAWSTRAPHAMASVGASAPRDSQAYALDRQARLEIDQRTEASVARAVGLLQRAIARDSDYVDSWADLTRALVFAENNRYDVPGVQRTQLAAYAVRAGERAVEADSMSAAAWIARATTLYLIEPTASAGVIRALHRAIALDSSSAAAWTLLGAHYEDALDADSALLSLRRAISIAPTYPQALAFLALHFMWQRQLDSATVWADRAAQSNPTNVLSRQVRGLVLIQQGRVTEASDEFKAITNLGQGPERVWGWAGLAVVAQRRHDRPATDSLIAHAIADADTLHPSHHEAVYLAWIYAETGQRERALAVLERFAEPRHLHFQLHLRREFTLDSLRREPRFTALLRKDIVPRRGE